MRRIMPAKTAEVFDYLKWCAKNMCTTTYGDVAEQTGLAPVGVRRPLDYIWEEVVSPRGLPWIFAIVVNADTRRPGDGFLPEDLEISDADYEHFWRGMVLQVFAYNWDDVEL